MTRIVNDKTWLKTCVACMACLGLAPLAPVAAWALGGPVIAVGLAALLFAGLGLAARGLSERMQPIGIAVALIGQCLAFTAAFSGHPWQVDSHMLFYAVLAVVATMTSIPALVVAVGLTAGHHLLLGLALPSLVFPSFSVAEVLQRTLMHAVIVLFEAGILIWSMLRTQRTAAEIEAGRAALAESAEHAAAAQAEAEAERERAVATTERTREESQRAAAAVEEIAATAKAAAQSAATARTAAASAQADAERSGDVVQRARESMGAIEESSRQIGRIVAVIDEIARQTDLLALNAAVESARAGEAGRGFAVVAAEVRKLAQRSADATKEIRGLVSTSARQVEEGVAQVGETGRALGRIATAVSDLSGLVDEIAAGAAEQSIGLDQVSVAISRINGVGSGDAPPVQVSERALRLVG